MKRPAIFFDRDNTLIRNDGYLGDPAAVVLVEGAADAIARLRSFGYAIVTFSNQSGVARGMFTEDAVRAVNARMDELLIEQNPDAKIDCHEFCPYHPEATLEEYRQDSDLRKPKAGMILKAAEALELDLAASWVIGDAPRDIEAGVAAGCRTILFHDPRLPPSEAAKEAAAGEADYAVHSLRRAVEVIRRLTPGLEPEKPPASPQEPEAAAPPTGEGEPKSEAGHEPAGESKTPTARQQKFAATFATRAGADPRRAFAPTINPPSPSSSSPPTAHLPSTRLEILAQQILDELRRHRNEPDTDFSVRQLLAAIVQVLVVPVLFFAYLHRVDSGTIEPLMLLAIFLQVLALSLKVVGLPR